MADDEIIWYCATWLTKGQIDTSEASKTKSKQALKELGEEGAKVELGEEGK